MKPTVCIIIEDEFPASEILKSYLKEIPNWHINAVFENAIDAINYLVDHTVDVIFVDIKLPQLSGISFIRTLNQPPIIVVTTAYNEHAVEAFELVVFDYLLKPYSFERFVKTINRINHQLANGSDSLEIPLKEESPYIIVNENRVQVKLLLSEICFLESQKEYVLIICDNRLVKTKMGITRMAELLPKELFLRIHRSFMVNKRKIESYSTKKIVVKDQTLPIGRYYQKLVLEELLHSGMV
jgi:DNA-binding LytR/AlgR family response regulator